MHDLVLDIKRCKRFYTFGGTRLDVTGTEDTNLSKWPGDKKLRRIVKKVAAANCGRRPKGVSVSMKGNQNKDNQTNLYKFIKEARKEVGKKGA